MSQTEMTVQPMHIVGLDDRPVCGAKGRFWGDTELGRGRLALELPAVQGLRGKART